MKKNKEMALKLMLEGNMTMQEIADNVKKTRRTLYNWLENDEEFKEEYERRLADMARMSRARLGVLVPKAINRAEEILDNSRNDIAAANVIKDVLDRTGHSSENIVKIEQETPVQIINNIPKGENSG